MRAYYFNFNECQDLSLTEIATQKCEPFFSYGPTILNQYIFHYIISGKGYCCCGNSPEIWDNYELEVNAGEGFLLEPNVKHLYHADPQNPWHYIWIIFNGLSVPQYLHACGISKTISSTSQRITAHRLPLQIKSIYSRFTITPLLQKHISSAICIFFSMHLPRTVLSP